MWKKTILSLLLAAAMLLAGAALPGCTAGEEPVQGTTGTTAAGVTSIVTTSTEPVLSADDLAALIGKNLDILTEGFPYFTSEHDMIAAHPEEFDQIVSLGESAFPYLDEVIKKSDTFSLNRPMAMYAQYIIKPELYDLVFPSPNGKYAVKASVDSFMNYNVNMAGIDYCDIRLVECATDSTILSLNGIDNNISVEWSPDSMYAAMSHGILRYSLITDVFDIRNACFITMPTEKDIEGIIREKYSYASDIEPDAVGLTFDEWIAEGNIKIDVTLIDSLAGNFSGWYTYDLTKGKITDIDIEHGTAN